MRKKEIICVILESPIVTKEKKELKNDNDNEILKQLQETTGETIPKQKLLILHKDLDNDLIQL